MGQVPKKREGLAIRFQFLMAVLFILPMMVPLSSANMEACNPGGMTGGQCDDYDHADDGTPSHQDWIKADYRFSLISTTEFTLQITWAIHEYNRDSLGFGSGNVVGDTLEDADGLDPEDGLPADFLRESFSIETAGAGSPTVGQKIISQADSTIRTALQSGFGNVTQLSTNYQDTVQFGEDTLECSTDKAVDSQVEVPSLENNVFQPPLCVSAQATIELEASTFNLFNNTDLDLERAYKGLLVMGAEVETPFSIRAEPGMEAFFTISPPSYAQMVDIDEQGTILFPGTASSRGEWYVDNRDATMADSEVTQDISFRVSHQPDSQTPTVSVPEDAKSLDLRVVLNLEDENAVTLDFVAGIYYLEEATLSEWGISVFELTDSASIPLITSDGIRLAYQNGIIDLPALTDQFPIDNITQGVAGALSDVTDITMNPAGWVSSTPQTDIFREPGGLNYTHADDCKEPVILGVEYNYCLSGSIAMDGTYPVYLQSSSEPFPLRLVDILKDKVPNDNLKDMLTAINEEKLERLFNSNITIETVLEASVLDSVIPDILPSASLAIEIVLPSWIETKDGGSSIIIERSVDGTQNTDLSFKGTNPYEWDHEIFAEDDDEKVLCYANQTTCVISHVEFDWSNFGIHEWTQAVSFTFSFDANLDIYRIGIPLDRLEQEGSTQISFPVLPSDLLRLVIDVSSSMAEPLHYDDIYICDAETSSLKVCSEPINFVATQTGLKDFAEDLGKRITDYIHQSTAQQAGKTLGDGGPTIKEFDMSAFQIKLGITGIEPPTGDVSDEIPLGLSIEIPKVSFKIDLGGDLEKLQSGDPSAIEISILTDALYAPFIQSMNAAVTALQSLMINSLVGGDGLTTQTLNYETGEIDPNLNEEFDLDLSGPITIKLPRGLELKDVSSTGRDQNGNTFLQVTEDGGRQTITYTVPPYAFSESIEFKVHVSWIYFLIQFWYYPTIVLLLLFLLIRRRRRKKKRKKEQMGRQYDIVAKSSLDDSYFSAYASPSMNEGETIETLDDITATD